MPLMSSSHASYMLYSMCMCMCMIALKALSFPFTNIGFLQLEDELAIKKKNIPILEVQFKGAFINTVTNKNLK